MVLRRSLAVRLAVTYGLISFLVVSALGLGVYLLTKQYLIRQAVEDLDNLADFYAAYSSAAAPDEATLSALAPQIVSFFAPQANYDVRVFGARNGRLLGASRDIGQLPSSATLKLLSGRRPSLFLPASQDDPNRIYAVRQVAPTDGELLAAVEVSRDVGEIQSFLQVLLYILLAAGALAVLATLAASMLVARQLTRPLRQMESATQVIAGGDFGRRLVVASEDEIGRLGDSINRMAADLSRLEASRRDFIARISHDLRTPLTAIKGLVINLQDTAPEEMQPSLATMDEQTDRLTRLVEDLLTLSRLQRGALHLRMVEIDLGEIVQGAVSLAQQRALRLGIEMTLGVAENLPTVNGDADRLQQVVVNLLDNALRVTPVGGLVRVRVESRADGKGRPGGGEVSVTVIDDGQGLTAEEAALAFKAYHRGPGGGAGLGLTIAKEIVSAHGGRIWLAPRPEGGAEAGFSLPYVPPEEAGVMGKSVARPGQAAINTEESQALI